MKTRLRLALLLAQAIVLFVTPCFGKNSSELVKQRERNTISLELEISKRIQTPCNAAMSFHEFGS